MRGKDTDEAFYQTDDRITPAYAGKRQYVFQISIRWKDHPRLCGEKPPASGVHAVEIGSPPPMRGKGTGLMYRGCGDGITPAYAGKS